MSLLTKALAINGPMLSALTVAKGTKVSAERDLKSVDELAALLTSPLSKRYFTEDEIRERAREEMRRTGKSAEELLSDLGKGGPGSGPHPGAAKTRVADRLSRQANHASAEAARTGTAIAHARATSAHQQAKDAHRNAATAAEYPHEEQYHSSQAAKHEASEKLHNNAASTSKASGPFSIGTDTDVAAHAASTSPTNNRTATNAQIEAGNYKKGHITISGLNLSIENPEGSTRSSKPGAESLWEREIKDAHYGYLRGVVGQDKDHLDVFLKPSTPIDWSGSVYVIHQTDQDSGEFDEHKVMLGYSSEEAAKSAYKANYPDGWTVGNVETMTLREFKDWTASGSVVQRLFGSARKVAFTQPAPFLSKAAAASDLAKEITTGTGLSTPQAGLTHYDRTRTAKQAFDDTVAAVDAARKKQITEEKL